MKDALAIAESRPAAARPTRPRSSARGSAVAYEIKVALADKEQEVKVGPDGQVMKD